MKARNKSLQNEFIETKCKSAFRILKEANFFSLLFLAFFLFFCFFLLQVSLPKGPYMKVHSVLALSQIDLICTGNGQESWVVSSQYLMIITVLSIEHLVWATRWKVMLMLKLPVWLLPSARFHNDLTALVTWELFLWYVDCPPWLSWPVRGTYVCMVGYCAVSLVSTHEVSETSLLQHRLDFHVENLVSSWWHHLRGCRHLKI